MCCPIGDRDRIVNKELIGPHRFRVHVTVGEMHGLSRITLTGPVISLALAGPVCVANEAIRAMMGLVPPI
jgi:hypothetical protein